MTIVERVEPVDTDGRSGEANTLVQVMYASAALAAFTARDLAELLARARAHNEVCDVSGLLVYFEGSFLQVLEGPNDDVELLYQSITRDSRHTKCRLLLRTEIEEREFGEWSMGFADPRMVASAMAGYVDMQAGLSNLVHDTQRAKSTLIKFRDGAWR
jgi:Sensors of blue-light using FAD